MFYFPGFSCCKNENKIIASRTHCQKWCLGPKWSPFFYIAVMLCNPFVGEVLFVLTAFPYCSSAHILKLGPLGTTFLSVHLLNVILAFPERCTFCRDSIRFQTDWFCVSLREQQSIWITTCVEKWVHRYSRCIRPICRAGSPIHVYCLICLLVDCILWWLTMEYMMNWFHWTYCTWEQINAYLVHP